MEALFLKLEKDGKNHVDDLMKWLKNANLVTNDERGVVHVLSLFDNPTPGELVDIDNFKRAVRKFADEQEKYVEEIGRILAEEGPNLRQAIKAGVHDLKDQFTDDFPKVSDCKCFDQDGNELLVVNDKETKPGEEGTTETNAKQTTATQTDKEDEKGGEEELKVQITPQEQTKLIEGTKAGEEKVKALFAGVDQKKVEMSKFKEVVTELAREQGKSFEQVSEQLAKDGTKFMQSAIAGVAALKDKFLK